jgi:hypothetical protein
MKSTNLVVFTVKVETYQRNGNCKSKQGNQTGIYSESLETCLLHEVLQVMLPLMGALRTFPSRFSNKNKFFPSESMTLKGPHQM